MRQWLVDPKIMCRKHLLGEHVEHHMIVGAINRGTSLKGFLEGNLLEPSSLIRRHEELVAEMEWRGYNHNSPLQNYGWPYSIADYVVKIDRVASLKDLLQRCPECLANFNQGEAK